MKEEFIVKSAVFSQDRKYRHMLYRQWESSKPSVAFIGLNPSTANADVTDPTITNVCKIAKANGYGGVYMLNLFSVISPDPKILLNHHEDLGNHIERYTDGIDVVFAWGNFEAAKQRDHIFIRSFPNALCISKNKNGSPKHPLYCKSDSKLIKFHETK